LPTEWLLKPNNGSPYFLLKAALLSTNWDNCQFSIRDESNSTGHQSYFYPRNNQGWQVFVGPSILISSINQNCGYPYNISFRALDQFCSNETLDENSGSKRFTVGVSNCNIRIKVPGDLKRVSLKLSIDFPLGSQSLSFYNSLSPNPVLKIPDNKIHWTYNSNYTEVTTASAYNSSSFSVTPQSGMAFSFVLTYFSEECPESKCFLDTAASGSSVYSLGQSEEGYDISIDSFVSILFSDNFDVSKYEFDFDSGVGKIMYPLSQLQANFAWLSSCSRQYNLILHTAITKNKTTYRLSCGGNLK